MVNLEVFTVCNIDKLHLLERSAISWRKYCDATRLTIITPEKHAAKFEDVIRELKTYYNDVSLIPDECYITRQNFQKVIVSCLQGSFEQCVNGGLNSSKYVGWYYQQILKLTHALHFSISRKCNVVMIDPDTEFIRPVKFFSNLKSILYISQYEKIIPYRRLCEDVFLQCVGKWKSSTIQFFALTPNEAHAFLHKINLTSEGLLIDPQNLASTLSGILLKSVVKLNGSISGNFMSEQDLLAFSKSLNSYSYSKKSLMHLRYYLSGCLSRKQQVFLAALGFYYCCHEAYYHKYKIVPSRYMPLIALFNIPAVYRLLHYFAEYYRAWVSKIRS
jgi:hypothetical protein